MDADLDPFDDVLPKPARAGGKFQPKAKPRSTKVASVSVPPIPRCNDSNEVVTASSTSVDTSNSAQLVDVTKEKLTGHVSLVFPSAPFGAQEPLRHNHEKPKSVLESGDLSAQCVTGIEGDRSRDPVFSSLAIPDIVGDKEPQKDNAGSPSHEKESLEAANCSPGMRSDACSVRAMDLETAISDGNDNQRPNIAKSAGETGLLGFDSDLLDDILPNPCTTNSKAGGKFKPKSKSKPKNDIPVPDSSSPYKFTEEETETHSWKTQSADPVDVTNASMDQVGAPFPNQDSVESREPSKDDEILLTNDKSLLESVNPLSDNLATVVNVRPQSTQLADVKAGNDTDQAFGLGEPAMEVDSLTLDLDSFDYIIPQPAISAGRAGGKFQPRAKAWPRKVTSELVSSAVPGVEGLASAVMDNMMPAKSSVAEGGRLTAPVVESVTSVKTMELGRKNRENLPPEILVPDSGEKDAMAKSSFSAHNSVDSFAFREHDVSDVDCVIINEAAVHVREGRSKLEESGTFPDSEVPGVLPLDADESLMPPPNAHFVPSENLNIGESSVASFLYNNFDDSSSACLGGFISADPCTLSNIAESSCLDDLTVVHPEGVPDMSEMESPKSRGTEVVSASTCSLKSRKSSLAGDRIDHDKSSRQPWTAEGQFVDEPGDDVHDSNGLPSDNLDDDNIHEANVGHSENLHSVPGKEGSMSKKRKVSPANRPQRSKKSSVASDINLGDKSSRQLRKEAAGHQVVDEPEDEAPDNSGFPAEPPGSSIDEEDHDYEPRGDEESDDEYRVENESRKRRGSRKSKEPVADKEKPARRRKKSNGVSEQSTKKPPKKFTHSTRQNRRQVNKDLLNMPEDEIDFKRLPIRDIILFAEYKERLAMKEATTSKTPSNNQSSNNPSHGEYSYNEEDGFDLEQDRRDTDDQTYVTAKSSSFLFNHQSFMDRAPNSRWSKQDTELFYAGILQFGTDLSMIQQLFPGRTRHQIKLKYKKEERQHPLRLHEALSSRPKDHSYFEKLIEQLQEVQEEQESFRDDTVDVSGEEDAELNAETNEEEMAKNEQDEDARVEEDQEGNIAEDHGPVKSGDSDDDGDIWSSYRSEF